MQVSQINNYNGSSPNFGHSFRVSICLKDENGIVNNFVNPAKESKLYQKLNSKIVSALNEDYYDNLRNILGLSRKTKKAKNTVSQKMADQLRYLDHDYSMFNLVRSVYSKNKLGYIATGPDVSIIENIKGAKHIGIAKSDAIWTYGVSSTDYVRDLSSLIKGNMLNYVQGEDILLRSKNNKEIMLKAIFRKTGTSKKPVYELDSYEFHENVTKPLNAPNPIFYRYKRSQKVIDEIKQTIQYHVERLTKNKRRKFDSLDKVLYPKINREP